MKKLIFWMELLEAGFGLFRVARTTGLSGSLKATGSDWRIEQAGLASCALRAPGQASSPGHPLTLRPFFIGFLILTGTLMLTAPSARADEAPLPDAGFPASRYETLWTKSPFAVATAEAAQESPDYMLVGVSNVDGIFYASLIERQSQEHFLISSDKATRGLTLTSVKHGPDAGDTYAVVQKDGQPITLKLEQAPVVAAGPNPNMPQNMIIAPPGAVAPQIIMPGANFTPPGSTRPLVRFRRPVIHLPPPSAQPAQPVPVQSVPPPPQ